MAYSFGGGIRPELGRTDYTPYLQGALSGAQMSAQGQAAIGQGLQNLLIQAGEGVKKYQDNKATKELLEASRPRFIEAIKNNETLRQTLGITDFEDQKQVDVAIKGLGGGDIKKGLMLGNQLLAQAGQQQAQEQQQRNLAQQSAAVANLFSQYSPEQLAQINMGVYDPRAVASGRGQAIREQLMQAQTYGAMADANRQPAPDAVSREIQMLMETNPELTYREAVAVATGNIDVQKDPVTGNIQLVNKATGTVRSIDDDATPVIPQEAAAAADEAPTETLYALADRATGIVPAAVALGQRVAGGIGQIVGKDIQFANAPEVIQAQQTFETAQRALIRSLSNNPRFPVGEMEAISREIDVKPSVWTDPTTLKSRIESLGPSLRRRMKEAQADGNNARLSKDDRADARKIATDIGNFLTILGGPEQKEISDEDLFKTYGITP